MTALAPQSASLHADRLDEAAVGARKVRVLFVNDTARNGGPGRSLHAMLKFLDPALVHRAVVLPRDGAVASLLREDAVVDELHFVADLVENPVQPWRRPMERRDFAAPAALKTARVAANALRGARALARLSSLVRRGGFDLVYCNGTTANFAGAVVAAATGAPALWHVRYTSVPPAVGLLHARLARSDAVRRILCVSRAAASQFARCAAKVHVVHNALDLEAFDPSQVRGRLRAELGIGPDVVVVGSHGRVLRRKGYVEFVRAGRLALDRMDGAERSRVAFVVVGDTPQDFRPDHVEECKALAGELGLLGRFHMLGFRPDVRPFVADFDLAVVPSVYADPLPRAVIESMALAKPVVAFDVGGVSEMIEHGITGELVPFEPGRDGEGASAVAVERLAAALARHVRDPALRARQGAAGRRRVEREFDARVHARLIQREIVASSAPRGGRRR
ncbi:MAG TPA: glycosyltransferase family 4 protein [Polyangiaceae bacterium]|nr:glycosyltransferase family 4 protein [Polyangiaceae bacterium]